MIMLSCLPPAALRRPPEGARPCLGRPGARPLERAP
jgi:hypothetical protein